MKENRDKYQISPSYGAHIWKTCLIFLLIQCGAVLVLSYQLYIDFVKTLIVTTIEGRALFIAKYVTMYIQIFYLLPYIKSNMNLMKYIINHPERFDNSFQCFLFMVVLVTINWFSYAISIIYLFGKDNVYFALNSVIA